MSAPIKLMLCRSLYKRPQHTYTFRAWVVKRHIADLTINHKVRLDPNVKAGLEDGSIESPKKHPGLVTVKAVKLPNDLAKAMEVLLEKYPLKDVRKKSEGLFRQLWSRQLKQPSENIKARVDDLRLSYLDKARQKKDIENMTDEEQKIILDKIEVKVKNRIQKETYNWEAMRYDAFKSYQYMLSRLPKEYSVLYQIFSEIHKRDSSFEPKTMFDFGSGLGSSVWASQAVWPKSIYEYICVEPSTDMTVLSRLLLQGGSEVAEMLYKGVHYVSHYPTTNPHSYDIVVSAFTFMELATRADRLQTLLSLWEKTGKYLLLVENGSKAGFQLVSEARDFLLQMGSESDTPQLKGHVFAPCPHDQLCPRGLRNDGTPCNFEVVTGPLPKNLQTDEKKPFRYSYVVLQKGERDTSVPAWPRLVRPTSAPSRRVNCRTCSATGQLERTVVSMGKHGRELLRCTRACRWGDLVPMVNDTEVSSAHGDGESTTEETFIPGVESDFTGLINTNDLRAKGQACKEHLNADFEGGSAVIQESEDFKTEDGDVQNSVDNIQNVEDNLDKDKKIYRKWEKEEFESIRSNLEQKLIRPEEPRQ